MNSFYDARDEMALKNADMLVKIKKAKACYILFSDTEKKQRMSKNEAAHWATQYHLKIKVTYSKRILVVEVV